MTTYITAEQMPVGAYAQIMKSPYVDLPVGWHLARTSSQFILLENLNRTYGFDATELDVLVSIVPTGHQINFIVTNFNQ